MEQTNAANNQEKKKKAGFFLRWFGKGGRTQGVPITGGAAESGGAVSGGLGSAASRAAVGQQLMSGGMAGAGRMGLSATIGSFFGSPAGFILLLAGVAVAAGATAMYFADRSAANNKYAAQFTAGGENSSGGSEARGSAASGVPAAGYADGEDYEPVRAGSAAEASSEEEGYYAASGESAASQAGQSEQGQAAKSNSLLDGEFAKQFGKAGGLSTASKGAFSMDAPSGKDSASTAIASGASAVSARGGARPGVGVGGLAAMNRSRGASGGSHSARGGAGGRSRTAWAQAGVVKTSLDGAASSGGEAGSAQASNTWDGGASGGGASGGGSSDGGSASVSVPNASAAGVDASVSGGAAGGGAGGAEVGEPGLEEQSYMENLETPFLKNTQAVTMWTTAGSIALGILALLWKALQGDPEPITKAILIAAVVVAVAAIVASIGFILYNAITLWSQYGQAAEGIAGIASAAAIIAGAATCFAGGGMKFVLGFAALAPMIPMIASPLLKSVFKL
ncbi:MAG: hypothetical protein GX410_09400 [Elusimicrobia bacterium]|nr:hypothetical protein [Elusimicrobiota bacterium]